MSWEVSPPFDGSGLDPGCADDLAVDSASCLPHGQAAGRAFDGCSHHRAHHGWHAVRVRAIRSRSLLLGRHTKTASDIGVVVDIEQWLRPLVLNDLREPVGSQDLVAWIWNWALAGVWLQGFRIT